MNRYVRIYCCIPFGKGCLTRKSALVRQCVVRPVLRTLVYVYLSSGRFCRYKMALLSHYVAHAWVVRTVWCKPVSKEWWTAVKNGLFGDEWWKDNFRMTRDTFDMLCSYLHPHLAKKVTRFRNPACSCYNMETCYEC